MNDYIAFSAYFGAALTLIIYVVSFRISDRIGHPLANPILICLALLIGALLIFDIDYDAYNQSSGTVTSRAGGYAVRLAPHHIRLRKREK